MPDTPTPQAPALPRGSLTRTVQAVAWSFIGLRRGRDHQEDVQRLNPLHIVAVGLLGAVLFVGTLMLVVATVV